MTEGPPWPVLVVTSVETCAPHIKGGLEIIRVRGLVTSDGWGEPHLMPITQGEPLDGMLDLIFQAQFARRRRRRSAPSCRSRRSCRSRLAIPTRPCGCAAGTNAVTLKTMPGYMKRRATTKAGRQGGLRQVPGQVLRRQGRQPAGRRGGRQDRARGRPAVEAARDQARPTACRATLRSQPADARAVGGRPHRRCGVGLSCLRTKAAARCANALLGICISPSNGCSSSRIR